MYLTYKYRLLPTRAQHKALSAILEQQRQLYNAALQERIDCYRKTGRSISYAEQSRGLTVWRRDDPEAAAVMRKVQELTLDRLDRAYSAFFRRIKSGQRPGFPRFRGKDRWDSFDTVARYLIFDGHGVRLKGLPGRLRLHLHRSLPAQHRIVRYSFKRDPKGWSIGLQLEVPESAKRPIVSAVGLDLGLSIFAYQSDGVILPNPRVARRAERSARLHQRALSRCRKGSRRRAKVRAALAKMQAKIVNTRATWMHQQSARLVRSYDLIAAEDLNVGALIKNRNLARSISDAGWSKFLGMVAYKAEWAGKHFVTVDPRNTSKRCSGCGELVPKSLAVRTHSCPSCGLVIDRDWNAALNILAAVTGRGPDNVTQRGERSARNLKAVERPQ